MSKRTGIIAFVSVIQSILFLTHFLIYKTWMFGASENAASALWLKVTVGVLSVSFLAASLLAFRYTNPTVRTLYRIAAVWLGIVSFLFFCGGGFVGDFRHHVACRRGCEFPRDRGGLVRGRNIERNCGTAERGVDAHPANHRAA